MRWRTPTRSLFLASSRQRRFGIGTRSQAAQLWPKLATGIEGFDALSRGGLPRHRTRHLIKLGSLIREHRHTCLVIDPLTAIAKASSLGAGRTVANRIIYMAKDAGITALVTALSEATNRRPNRPTCRSRRSRIPGSTSPTRCGAASATAP